jgi:hypothetical protein
MQHQHGKSMLPSILSEARLDMLGRITWLGVH